MGRFLVTAFFAVVFGQSALDKIADREGNTSYFKDHFKGAPFGPEMVPLLLTAITVIEGLAALLCTLGVVFFSWRNPGCNLASCGVSLAGFALLCLMTGQRLAKDYAGAAVLAAYFAVALVGLSLF
jgi:hypothetical protein